MAKGTKSLIQAIEIRFARRLVWLTLPERVTISITECKFGGVCRGGYGNLFRMPPGHQSVEIFLTWECLGIYLCPATQEELDRGIYGFLSWNSYLQNSISNKQ
ncbi:hypothetical protein GOODEAATRI_022663 [Goodea atripinnis]|uniref:Uncharacterized protein n=1 Tax=Goodea atripinnis TaxID=208336 RepID=A0ABV0NPU1_9TELE